LKVDEHIRIMSGESSDSTLSRFEHHAMNTVFEIRIVHDDQNYAEKAAHAAFEELDRLEQELSRFLPNSEISRINNLKYKQSTVVSTDTYYCLQECLLLYNLTKGTFDISAGPLIDLWKPRDDMSLKNPDPEKVKEAIEQTGLSWLHLHPESFTVELQSSGITLDLGGYGKGYALTSMKELLIDWGIKTALLHSGYSTVLAFSTEQEYHWPVSIQIPQKSGTSSRVIHLSNKSLSGSGMAKGKHIVDPRTGKPVQKRVAAWVLADQPDHADAFSTAFLIMSYEEINALCSVRSIDAVIVEGNGSDERYKLLQFGEDNFGQ